MTQEDADRVAMTTQRVVRFATERFEMMIADLLDDPSSYLDRDDEHPQSSIEAISELRRLAHDLELDFDALIERGSPYEIARLRAMEAGKPIPELSISGYVIPETEELARALRKSLPFTIQVTEPRARTQALLDRLRMAKQQPVAFVLIGPDEHVLLGHPSRSLIISGANHERITTAVNEFFRANLPQGQWLSRSTTDGTKS